jgi:hypothetical protein
VDAIKLKNSCICGNTLPYPDCCGRFAQAPGPGTSHEVSENEAGEPERKWAEFRHVFHELYMYLFPLRNLYQAYWEKLSQEDYPHHLLMSDGEYGRAVVANFFWDYSVQFSDSRPILRAARDIEGKDLRVANDFRQWSLSALCPAFVVEVDSHYGYLRIFGAEKLHRVMHGGALPEPGTYAAVRLLSYRGEEYVHPAILALPSEEFSEVFLEKSFRDIYAMLGLKSGAGLRPDVQCEEWRRHGALFLSLWRERTYDAVVGVPASKACAVPAFSLPIANTADAETAARKLASSGAVPLGKARFEVRYRALSLARLEMRSSAVQVTLMDESFRLYILRWLEDHLGVRSPDLEELRGNGEKVAPPFSPEGLETWMDTSLSFLNGETPHQAQLHDFGRNKLQALLRELSEQGREVSLLRHRLGL